VYIYASFILKQIKTIDMKNVFFCLIVLFSTVVCHKSYSQKDTSVIELTNKLGITVTIALANEYHFPDKDYEENNNTTKSKIKLGNTFPEQICYNLYQYYGGFKFVIKLQDNAYILAPLGSIKEVTFKDGNHIITLRSGTTVVGKLIGQFKVNDKVYDMPSVSSIKIIKLGKSDSFKKILDKKTWKLATTVPNLLESIIVEPKFAVGNSSIDKIPEIVYA